MKLLVTGGAGFIGSNFIRHMLMEQDEVHIVNLDCLSYAGNLENLSDLSSDSRYTFIRGDIASVKDVEKCFSQGIEAMKALEQGKHHRYNLALPSRHADCRSRKA